MLLHLSKNHTWSTLNLDIWQASASREYCSTCLSSSSSQCCVTWFSVGEGSTELGWATNTLEVFRMPGLVHSFDTLLQIILLLFYYYYIIIIINYWCLMSDPSCHNVWSLISKMTNLSLPLLNGGILPAVANGNFWNVVLIAILYLYDYGVTWVM